MTRQAEMMTKTGRRQMIRRIIAMPTMYSAIRKLKKRVKMTE
jgi:hypothetical protein